MRAIVLLLGTSLLAACGGNTETGIASGGSTAPDGSDSSGIIPGSGHTFVNPTEEKTYTANGVTHKYNYAVEINNLTGGSNGQRAQLYAGNATTVRDSDISIAYNPRDAIFEFTITDDASGAVADIRFQDPAHRTDFGGAFEPQTSTPNLSADGIQYLQVSSASAAGGGNTTGLSGGILGFGFIDQGESESYDLTTFFYQEPGTTTSYVTYAGYLRNSISATRTYIAADPENGVAESDLTSYSYGLERGAFIYGEATPTSDVPTSGTGSYTGSMLATAVLNDRFDDLGADAATYFQWIEGTSNLDVDFGANTFSLDLDGVTFAPEFDVGTNGIHSIAEGAIFTATGSGNINLVSSGGFVGQFQQAWFTNPDSSQLNLLIEGSSIDGAFYGPNAVEAAGNFRVVGGTPDERIDVLGVFTGAE